MKKIGRLFLSFIVLPSVLLGQEVEMLPIPEVEDLFRMDGTSRPSREVMRNSSFVLNTDPHEVEGERYLVLTDHSDPAYLRSLNKLATHRKGTVVKVSDLSSLPTEEGAFERVRSELRTLGTRFVAVAPKVETFGENGLLGVFELLATLDDDPHLDAYPGFLIASDASTFASLIDRSIAYQPLSPEVLKPFAVSQVPSLRELRSLQKAGILRKLFGRHEVSTPTVAIYQPEARGGPGLPGKEFWIHEPKGRRDFLTEMPGASLERFEKANLLIMHGHGIPGMSCSVDIGLFAGSKAPGIVMCGSCFSASPARSDLPAMRQAPGGYGVQARDAFVLRAIDSGATVAFGHMRLSQGFPHLFPVLESWMKGGTVGEAYQQLINALLIQRGFTPDRMRVPAQVSDPRRIPQNALLYVVVGDPALQPMEALLE